MRSLTRAVSPSALFVALLLLTAACGSSADEETTATASSETSDVADVDLDTDESSSEGDEPAAAAAAAGGSDTPDGSSTFLVEVWADNWMAVYIDGVLIGEDSVSITTERSFNEESFTFDASYPFTVAIEAKDFKETDSGLEYIGENNQQMGDGGLIAQVTDIGTGEVVAVTSADWSTLVVHRAPLNVECERDTDPTTTCEFEIIETPSDWTDSDFDDSSWGDATEWSATDVGPKDGYDEITWDQSAQLVWGSDLEVDNTVLLRLTVAS